jgi:hypothetical protein
MGACPFITKTCGPNAQTACDRAVKYACHEHGHGGYTGTIAEKSSFTIIPLPPGTNADDEANRLIDDEDPRIDNKWGPAGCFDLGKNFYVFFGRASE